MGLDDLFENKGQGKHGRRGEGRGAGYDAHGHDDHGRHGHEGNGSPAVPGEGYGDHGGFPFGSSHGHHPLKTDMFRKLLANKPLVIGLAAVAVILLGLALWLLVALLGMVNDQGVKGLLEKFDIPGLLKRLWEGAGKGTPA
jgi:hypothetical protein